MWAEDDLEEVGGRWGANERSTSVRARPQESAVSEKARQQLGSRGAGNGEKGTHQAERSPRDNGGRAARRDGSRYDYRVDDDHKYGGGRRGQGSPGSDRRGSRGDMPRDWIPDRFNRSEQGGRPREDGLEAREAWGGGRGHDGPVRGGGRGRGRRDDSGTDDLPVLYSIHRASVQSVRPFGLFVKLEGYRRNGLVHVTQVSDHEVTRKDDAEDAKVDALRGVATEGDHVWVKVISLKEGEGGGGPKVGCSLKLVSQADGRDLDANNLILDKHERKPAWQQPQKLELGAVLAVTCTRCGGRGHLKTDCYAALDTHYDLLPEEDEAALPTARPGVGAAAAASRGQGSGANDVPLGRGRGITQPAWMTQSRPEGGPVIGQPVREDRGAAAVLPAHIGTVEEALAVIEKLKKEKKERKAERKERQKAKEKRRRKRRKGGSSNESESESESESERRRRKRRRKERRERKRKQQEGSESASDSGSGESCGKNERGQKHEGRGRSRKKSMDG
ncbi:hypothetical protein KFL_000010070 [Klebsormidium nitens]|uniref:CCHC-type domain-containing protein n=1 Tax=Klebsormidium nitens TaxID=105231 RepID=A0A0U9HHG3_KLENI|nr:hypothetical protein KFL_000010070 [Klebsormidium nitens]|eukprot:GAQ77558.1 hypothetical protein KFL_000010070 [Klebsormidium nitens]